MTHQRRPLFLLLAFIAVATILLVGYQVMKPKPKSVKREEWTTVFKGLGTLSSPRLADLNNDGILDLVMGAGGIEFKTSDSAIIAVDGANGQLLWNVRAKDQIFGSPLFRDITGDGIPDVFMGGRAAEFKAIDGETGAVIWDYFTNSDNRSESDSGTYNFFSPQFIPDQDGDGFEELVVAAGGYVKALPHDPKRPPGRLLVLSSATGKRLAAAVMPDGFEIYMSVVVADFKKDGNLSIIFGTGGETLEGSLYKASLADLMKNDLSKATRLESGQEKGFVAPPVLADITQDGIVDIIANAVNGRMIAIDGATERVLWWVTIPKTEAYCSLAVGYFTDDGVPDFFTNYGIGTWPNLNRSVQLMVNGKTGRIAFQDSLGSFQESSPLAFDYNRDGFDDALLSLNYNHFSTISNQLMVIDFHNDTTYQISKRQYGANVASTPWLGDLDADGLLDLVYAHEINPVDLLSVKQKKGLKINKLKLAVPVQQNRIWGGYMGSEYNGIFQENKKY
ncbi:outer membrane protein assembly factor BamB family protein [Larkinella punicea]|nr:PQQ-binding-like beta-propeller repeat protein [Larkinella punicea]